MKRFAWLTDIHLNFLAHSAALQFLESVAEKSLDAVLLGGDIAESPDVCDYLALMQDAFPGPIYFVLGNHDYYRGSIADVRQRVDRLCHQRPRLHYLSHGGVENLTPHVALVGHDGWGDARAGNFQRSLVQMQDFRLIRELAGLTVPERQHVLGSLGDEAAHHLRRVLPEALERSRDVLLLTHVPPLREASWHEGGVSNDQWAPHFTCLAVGEAILQIMTDRPERRLTVLCGHTHGSGTAQPLPNVQIFTGGAEYGHPVVQRILEFD